MRKRFAVSGSVFLLFMLCGFGVWPHLGLSSAESNQDEDKIIEKKDDFDPPVKIILVKSKLGIIETDKKITASDDWLKGLTISVRNDSDKPVNGVSIYLQFRRPENQPQEPDLLAPIEHGPDPFAAPEQKPALPVEPILPGQTRDIVLSDEGYESLRAILDKLSYPASIKAVKLRIRAISFSDDTAWNSGSMFRRDPNQPDKWIRAGQSKGDVKKTLNSLKMNRLQRRGR